MKDRKRERERDSNNNSSISTRVEVVEDRSLMGNGISLLEYPHKCVEDEEGWLWL